MRSPSRLSAVLAWSVLIAVSALAQSPPEHRQIYLALLHEVRPAEMETYLRSNRDFASAMATHAISDPALRWAAYGSENDRVLWLYPIDHLGDVETVLYPAEVRLEVQAKKDAWNISADAAVDHFEEFILRDEPSLSLMPPDLEEWAKGTCEFRLYYAYGGTDPTVRELWRKYRATLATGKAAGHYRVLRVLMGLERPTWMLQTCGNSWSDVESQQQAQARAAGAEGNQLLVKMMKSVRRIEVWRFRFDPGMSYPRAAARP